VAGPPLFRMAYIEIVTRITGGHVAMTGTSSARGEPVHPYRRAWETRDVQGWGEALAEDLVVYSPVLTKPFVGRILAIELFSALFASIGDFRIRDELVSDGTSVFCWEADFRGRTIEGVDVVRMNAQGLVQEIRVLIRPLINIAIFGRALGPPLAAKRSSARSYLVRALNAPLKPLFAMVDATASRLLVPPRLRQEQR
jgi:hypothetical protein